jgi:hypothetical protein
VPGSSLSSAAMSPPQYVRDCTEAVGRPKCSEVLITLPAAGRVPAHQPPTRNQEAYTPPRPKAGVRQSGGVASTVSGSDPLGRPPGACVRGCRRNLQYRNRLRQRGRHRNPQSGSGFRPVPRRPQHAVYPTGQGSLPEGAVGNLAQVRQRAASNGSSFPCGGLGPWKRPKPRIVAKKSAPSLDAGGDAMLR